MSLPRRLKSTRGMSIVEVLVVMVVLLVGIMSVVSMFPSGFKAVRHAENMTFADRLAQGEMERWKDRADNLPYGVVPITISGTTMNVENDQNPNPPISDAKAFNVRRILGETTKIPVGTPFRDLGNGQYEQASMYTVAYAPIETVTGLTDANGNAVPSLVVTGGSMRRHERDSDDNDAAYSLRMGDYGIDYDTVSASGFKACFPVLRRDATYYVSYSYWIQNNGSTKPEIESVVDQLVVVAANTAGWVDVPFTLGAGQTFVRLEDGSDAVARGFIELAYTDNWDDDYPYEFKRVSNGLTDLLGIIAFNPYGYRYNEQVSRGMQPLEAHIDYNIRDLTIMHEDHRVDTSGRIKLGLKYLLKLGDPIETNQGAFYTDDKYHGIFARTDLNGTIEQVDVLALDLSTGQRLDLDPAVVTIDYENGALTFPANYTIPIGGQNVPVLGRNIRVLYKAEGDWSLQLQKAFEVYRRDYTGGAVDYRTYTVGTQTGSNNVWLRFAPCESSKTVSVDYAYVDANGIEHKVVGEAHQVPEATSSPGTLASGYWVQLDCSDPRKFGSDAANNTLTRIYSVTGVSLKIRVLWKEGKRWLYVDKDTTLLRKTTEV